MDYIELKVKVEPLEMGRDILIAQLSQINFESFVENNEGFLAYIQEELFNEDKLKEISTLSNPNFDIHYKIEKIEDQNWNKTWEENFDPIEVEGECYIRAPFHGKKEAVKYDIVIDPKMSFGTGHHETTYLMVKRLLLLDVAGLRVLDMGCGTAVLAILAKLKKANYIEAIDIDEWAFNNSIENIRNNNCDEIVIKKGGAELLSKNSFDIVLANINRNILLNDMSHYVNSLNKGGELLLSGFFKSDVDILTQEAVKNNLSLTFTESKNDWTILHFTKND